MYFSCGSGREFDASFSFPEVFLWPTIAEVVYRRWRFAVIVLAWKSDPVSFHQSPSNVKPHLKALSSLLASSSTAGTWLVPPYAAYFQFLTDGNEQYAILNIHSGSEISSVKKGSKKWKEMERTVHPKPRQSLSIKAVSHAINNFAVRAHPRPPHVTGTHSTARIQTTTYSPGLW